jgi:hypothetical protein
MKTTRRTGSNLTTWALAASVLLAAGCRGPWSHDWKYSDLLSPKKMTSWGDDESETQIPQRVVCSWTDTVLYQTGKQPQRGFGGRLIFYGDEADKPVLVDGQLVVYAFDESNRDLTDNKPTRRYVFPPDQIARRMSKTALGPSYSFWLPWDDAGGPETEVSLIARFEPKGGAMVVGEQTRYRLPGEPRAATGIAKQGASKLPAGIPMWPAAPTLASLAEQAQGKGANNRVQLASFESDVQEQPQPVQPAQPERRMMTTSISLPENFRLQGSGVPAMAPVAGTVATGGAPVGTMQVGNVLAEPQAPPPNVATVAAPISYPAVNMVQGAPQPARPVQQMQNAYPAFIMPQQSPLGNGFVAPLQSASVGSQQSAPATVGQIGVPPRAPLMGGQPPLTTAAGWATVTYPPAAGAAGSTTVR